MFFFFFCIYLYNFSIQGNDVSLILDTDCCKKTKRVLRRFVVDVNEKTVKRIVGNIYIYIILLSLFFIIYSTFSTKSRDWILSASQKEDDKITKSFNEKLQLILTSHAYVCVHVCVRVYTYIRKNVGETTRLTTVPWKRNPVLTRSNDASIITWTRL